MLPDRPRPIPPTPQRFRQEVCLGAMGSVAELIAEIPAGIAPAAVTYYVEDRGKEPWTSLYLSWDDPEADAEYQARLQKYQNDLAEWEDWQRNKQTYQKKEMLAALDRKIEHLQRKKEKLARGLPAKL